MNNQCRRLGWVIGLLAMGVFAPVVQAGEVRKLIDVRNGDQPCGGGALDDAGSSVSADGSVVVFASRADASGQGTNEDYALEVFSADTATGTITQLTSSVVGPYGYDSGDARVDAAGEWVVFQSDADHLPGGNHDYSLEIFRIRTDGSGLE